MMDYLLDQQLLAKLDGKITLTMEFMIQGIMAKLSIRMAQALSNATFGGEIFECYPSRPGCYLIRNAAKSFNQINDNHSLTLEAFLLIKGIRHL